MIAATETRRRREQHVVELTALRIRLDRDIAERQRVRDRVQAEIDTEVATLERAQRAARGARCTLAELVDRLTPDTTSPTKEGPS